MLKVLISFLFLLAGCGRVGAPLPPFIRIPEPIADLAVTQSGYDFVLTWTNPPRFVDGSAATNLARVQILANGSPVSVINIGAAGQAQSYAVPVGNVAAGPRSFRVIVETAQGRVSAESNVAEITPVEVPGRVLNLTATPDQQRIFLRWNAPQDHPELVDAYVVTRPDVPSEMQIVTEPAYTDIRYEPGKTFTYHVNAARRIDGRLVMGIGPEQVHGTAVDATAPAAPTGLEITQSYLTWEPNAETDINGYRVFRSDRSDAGFKALTDQFISATIYEDPNYRPGLYYRVSAVDQSENESPMSEPFRAP